MKQTWIFFTVDSFGDEKIVAIKRVKHPEKSKIYEGLKTRGFTSTVTSYGYRLFNPTIFYIDYFSTEQKRVVRKTFGEDPEEAEKWCRENVDNYHPDMLKVNLGD